MSARMSEHLRTAIGAALSHREPATDEDVRRAVSDALSVGGHNHTQLIHERLMRAEVRVPAIVRRLLDAEAEAERLRADRDQFADRVDTLTAVAKGNKAHVAELTRELSAAQRRKAELETAADMLSLASVLEIPRPGTGIPLQLRRSGGHADRWAICDETGRRWYPDGWMYEPADDRLCDEGRYTLAVAVPLARRIAAGGEAR